MDMTSKIARWMKRSGILLAAAIFVLTGCHGSLLTYKGSRALEPHLVALPNGVQEGRHYESGDLTIDYRLVRQGDELELSGTAAYTTGIIHAFSKIEFFNLSVLFTDQAGTVLEQAGIKTPGSDEPGTPMHFSEKMKLPANTAKMTFIYSGTGIEHNFGDGGGSSPFWQVPVVR